MSALHELDDNRKVLALDDYVRAELCANLSEVRIALGLCTAYDVRALRTWATILRETVPAQEAHREPGVDDDEVRPWLL